MWHRIALIVCLLFSLFLIQIYGAEPKLTGHWEGLIIRQGKEWRVWMDAMSHGDKLVGRVDFPDYGLYALPADLTVENDRVKMVATEGSTTVIFDGELSRDWLKGEWKGLDVSANFQMKRLSARPLNPYLEEEVTFRNGEANLVGTLIKPNKSGPHPAVVFTHGSGNQTRTQTFYRARAYWFARHGIAALIYDRRGRGASKGGEGRVTWENLADDALAGLKILQSRSDINPNRIGISGFSQGGWVSPLAALRSKEVAFVLVGSAAAVTPEEQNNYNVESVLHDRGLSEEKIKTVMELRRRIDQFLKTGSGDQSVLEAEIAKLKTETWFRNTLVSEKLTPYDAQSKAYITFDPGPIWEKITVPVFSVWGEKDMTVPPGKSQSIMENAFKKGRNKKYLFRMFPKAGHGLSLIREKDEEWDFPRLAPGYQEAMINWIQNIK